MRRTSIRTLALVLVSVAAVGALVLRLLEGYGVYLPQVAWVEYIAILGLAGGIFWAGWAVRAYQKGDKPDLDALRAARTFVLAKAGALSGALLGGRYLAEVVLHVGELQIEPRREQAIAAAIAVVCSLVLMVVGLVVEKFCELPPPDDTQAQESPDPLPS
jgi:phosphatidylglycerophosphate synthase